MLAMQYLATSTELLTSTSGSLNVNITGGSSSGAVTDSSAFTAASSLSTTIGGVFNDTPVAALTSGQQGAARLTNNRALHVNLRNQSGTELAGSQANGLNVIIGDGTNVPAVKAASTAAVAADKSLVVALSPNSPVPAGTNIVGGFFLYDSAGTNKAAVNSSGQVSVKDPDNFASTATLSSVSTSTTSATLLASNAARKGFILQNDGNKVVYVAFAATATTSAYTYQLAPGAVYESQVGNTYTGVISGINSTSTSVVKVTELT